ncbi:MAG: carboxypeptidase regulatory-like domain-containing protein [Bacteroidales bacterium]|jgi:outer membrane receptor protein involved in Fe transport|nr:carboxypeptidase regulatory-like domain-containing protein [Bacteroidales bacterium]
MIKRLLLTLGIMLALHGFAFSQGAGSLFGVVTDRESGEPIPFANVAIMANGAIVTGAQTDYDGKYAIRAINPGTYTLRVSSIGYQTVDIQGIVIRIDQAVPRDVDMKSTTAELAPVEIFDYKVPVFEADNTSVTTTVTADEIKKMPNRSIEGVVTSVGGVFTKDGEIGSIRGSREGAQAMFIDGMRVTSLSGIPASSFDQISTTLSGLPARYGDVTSGVINITTRGASRVFGMSAEVETSQFLDPYGYNRAELSINGPLWKKKNENGISRTIMGYSLSANFEYNGSEKSAVGYNRVSQEQLDYLHANPLVPGATTGTFQAASFVDPNDIHHYKTKVNSSNYRTSAVGRLTISPTQNVDITLGGTFTYAKGKIQDFASTLLNYDNFGISQSRTFRVYGRLTQRFESNPESTFKNFYYTIQANYENYDISNYNPDLKDKIFEYGYVGKFEVDQYPTFESRIMEEIGPMPVYVQNGWGESNLIFDSQNTSIPTYAAYNEYFINHFEEFGMIDNYDQLRGLGGLMNGESPNSIYSLWVAPGVPYSTYVKQNQQKWEIDASGSMDIGDHQIRLGFQYEQRNNASWRVLPTSLWTMMRQYTNNHIEQMDTSNPMAMDGGNLSNADTVYYYRAYDGQIQSMFDWNLRSLLGLDPRGLDYIYVDSYDPTTQTMVIYDKENNRLIRDLKDNLDISLFSPDDLFNQGRNIVSYYGYSYDGARLNYKPTLNDFFTKRVNVNGKEMYSREIAPYSPTYIGFWLEDKFTFNDIIFTVGLRIDGFDANQMTLKDNYLLYSAYNVGDLKANKGDGISPDEINAIPGNMGDDYVVYIHDATSNNKQITGFRNGNTWYNADGIEINDPNQIASAKGIIPFLENPLLSSPTVDAFEDYKTQVNVMPRISFSFPISDDALFFAHYDILTRRPSDVQIDPFIYLFFMENAGLSSFFSNPSLKPSQTIDYELGFKQKVSNNSAISLSAFYKEIRDEIQAYRFTGAYPDSYSSYNNIDFGTTKGLTLSYDLRRTNNIRLRADYTLQFATGTGSSPSTQAGLIAAQLPNLRTVIPLEYDRRHAINLTVDYHFSSGTDYNGPVIKREKKGKTPVQVLANAGLSIMLYGGSGTPYTRQANITNLIQGGTKLLEGTMNGSRMPWQFNLSAKIDKDFNFNMGSRKNGEKRSGSINVYLACNNILNTASVLSVYPKTGLPNDDGYLSAPESVAYVNSQVSPETFAYLYMLNLDRPGNYTAPRTLRLGLIFSFF